MTFEPPREAFVWIWLTGASDPVPVGRLVQEGGEVSFTYGARYLERPEAISLYEPELPLRTGWIRPLATLDAPGCILDALPDAWGQRVIMNRLLGAAAADADPADLGLLTYMLESGSDRTGAIDFQASPEVHVPRWRQSATLDDLASAAEHVQEGIPLPEELDAALLHGSSIGGARPKALIDDASRQLIAKFSSATDTYPVVSGEYVAMTLARRCGLNVADVKLTKALGKTALLVERFDRVPGTDQRLGFVSALTMLGLNELAARWASYADLAELMRSSFTEPATARRELFARIAFNILVGNTDDHARNHGAFWDGTMLTLTPAYDIAPQPRNTGRVGQAMAIGDQNDRYKDSQIAGAVKRAHLYGLSEPQAREIAERQIEVIRDNWDEVCDDAGLSEVDRRYFWRRQFLNDYALEGFTAAVT